MATAINFRETDRAISAFIFLTSAPEWLRPLIHKCDTAAEVRALGVTFRLTPSQRDCLEVVARYRHG